MNYPVWDKNSSDKELISDFYTELLKRYPELMEAVEDNEGLIHLDMMEFRILAEELCKERKIDELKCSLEWLNSYFCQSKNELLNAINVSFLEFFNFAAGITEDEFKEIMPPNLYRGYLDIMAYMEELSKDMSLKKETKVWWKFW